MLDVYLRQKNEWVSEEMKNEPHQLPASSVRSIFGKCISNYN